MWGQVRQGLEQSGVPSTALYGRKVKQYQLKGPFQPKPFCEVRVSLPTKPKFSQLHQVLEGLVLKMYWFMLSKCQFRIQLSQEWSGNFPNWVRPQEPSLGVVESYPNIHSSQDKENLSQASWKSSPKDVFKAPQLLKSNNKKSVHKQCITSHFSHFPFRNRW